MLVCGVVVENGVDQLAGRHRALDGIEEADQFQVAVARHALPITLSSSTLSAATGHDGADISGHPAIMLHLSALVTPGIASVR
jgi:hypothetical protein